MEKRVVKLAKDISDAVDSVIPRLLLQIQGLLDSCSGDGLLLLAVKEQLWRYELHAVMLTALKQDFNKILDGWNTAVKVARILVTCCTGWMPQEEANDFKEVFIPDCVMVLVSLANRQQKKYSQVSPVLEDTRKQLLANFGEIFEVLTMLCGRYEQLMTSVLQSVSFLQMILTDDVETGLLVLNFLQTANRQTPGLFASLDPKIRNQILDELTYKLSVSHSRELGSAATRCLNTMCDSHPPLVELLCSRYRGLRLLLISRQRGHGPSTDTQRLLLLLDMGNFQKAELEKLARAARLIQACWRSHRTRRRLKEADTAIARFQKSFRSRREDEQRRRAEEKMQSDLEHLLIVQRRYTMRQLHLRQLKTLEILPATEVNKHLASEQNLAAVKIQSHWKGYCTRHGVTSRRNHVLRVRAATVIQRSVRKWLARLRSHAKDRCSWQRPAGLTDDRRVQLQAMIQSWRESHPREPMTRDQQVQLHSRVQEMLRRHVVSAAASHRRQQHRDALMAQLDMDASLLLNAPQLSDISVDSEDYVDLLKSFTSRSVPVASKARLDHLSELGLLDQPWWRKLGSEYQDSKYTVDDYEDDDHSWKVF